MTDRAHSDLGPSGADRWIECPGSVLATKDMPDVETEYSKEGTLRHALAAGMVTAPESPSVVAGWDQATSAQRDAVNFYLDYVRELPGELFTEIRVDYSNLIEGGFGTSDTVKVTSDVWHIVDAKFGAGVQVYAERNPQLMLYAIGVLETLGWMLERPKKVVLHIVQPELDHIDTWETTLEEISQWMATVAIPAARRALQPGAPFRPGEWCQFCKLKAKCRTRAKSLLDVFGVDNLDAVPNLSSTPAELTDQEISNALHALPQMRSWASALEDYAMAQVQRGRKIGDWKLVEGRSNRSWREADGNVVAKLAEHFGQDFTPDKFFTDPELLSVAQVEKLVGKQRFKIVAELVHKPPGTPKLAPGTDKRPALNPQVNDVVDLDEEDKHGW